MAQIIERMNGYTAALNKSAQQTVEATRDTARISGSIEKSSKRVEYATYAILAATLATLAEPFIRHWLDR